MRPEGCRYGMPVRPQNRILEKPSTTVWWDDRGETGGSASQVGILSRSIKTGLFEKSDRPVSLVGHFARVKWGHQASGFRVDQDAAASQIPISARAARHAYWPNRRSGRYLKTPSALSSKMRRAAP